MGVAKVPSGHTMYVNHIKIGGDEDAVNNLLAKLIKDPRHKDLKILSRKTIERLTFIDWAMKFAPLDNQIRSFLKENGFQKFDPYMFSDDLVDKFLAQLFTINDPTSELKASELLNLSDSQKIDDIGINKNIHFKSNVALFFSLIALLISLISIFRG